MAKLILLQTDYRFQQTSYSESCRVYQNPESKLFAYFEDSVDFVCPILWENEPMDYNRVHHRTETFNHELVSLGGRSREFIIVSMSLIDYEELVDNVAPELAKVKVDCKRICKEYDTRIKALDTRIKSLDTIVNNTKKDLAACERSVRNLQINIYSILELVINIHEYLVSVFNRKKWKHRFSEGFFKKIDKSKVLDTNNIPF